MPHTVTEHGLDLFLESFEGMDWIWGGRGGCSAPDNGYLVVEGYPKEANVYFTKANVIDLVLYTADLTLTDFTHAQDEPEQHPAI